MSEFSPGPEIKASPEETVPLITVSHTLYPPGSLGYEHLPTEFEGRQRPAFFANIPLLAGKKTKAVLESHNIHTLADLFSKTPEDIQNMPAQYRAHVKMKMDRAIETLKEKQLVTPHGHFVAALLGRHSLPIPVVEETELKTVSEAILHRVHHSRQVLLSLHFGLDDWLPKTMDDVAYIYGQERKVVSRLVRESITQLRRSLTETDIENLGVYTDDQLPPEHYFG